MSQNDEKLKFGWFLRDSASRWSSLQFLAVAKSMVKDGKVAKGGFAIDEQSLKDKLFWQTTINKVIKDSSLNDIHTVKPLLDGKQICAIYEMKPGKMLKPLIDETINF